jgi:uncharacterized membrane protein
MKGPWEVRHVSVSIDRPPSEVYEFVSNPENLPKWASGLANGSVRQVAEEWVADAPMGKVKIRFAERNTFGVLDHDVTLESGATVRNPMRVLPNGAGSEVVFSLFRLPETSEAKFAEDGNWVAGDLRALKAVIEATRERP